jgi:integrase
MPGHVRNRGKREDGTTKWQARWRHPDDPSVRVERVFRAKAVAERWITQMESDALAGMFREDKPTDRPFSEVVEAWRETRSGGLAPGTRARYEQVLRTYLLPEFGNKKVSSLTREVVKRYFARLDNGGMKPGTLRKVHTTLSAVLSEAVELEIIKANPCAGALRGRRKLDHQEMLFLTAEEVDRLADAITRRYRTAIYTAAFTGLRASELWGLRVRDIDLVRGVLHVRQSLKSVEGGDVAKGNRQSADLKSRKARRTVPLPRFLRTLFAEHLAGRSGDRDALVFVGPSGAPVRHNLFYKRQFRPAAIAALPAEKADLRFHDLRHTYVSLCVKQGVAMKVIAEHVGHSTTAMTDRYAHLYDETRDATADALDAAYTGGQPAPHLRAVE